MFITRQLSINQSVHTCTHAYATAADDKFILEAAVTDYEHSFTMQAK